MKLHSNYYSLVIFRALEVISSATSDVVLLYLDKINTSYIYHYIFFLLSLKAPLYTIVRDIIMTSDQSKHCILGRTPCNRKRHTWEGLNNMYNRRCLSR